MPSSGSVRNVGLDLARAIAVSLVLICHGSGMLCYWIGVPWPLHLSLTGLFGVELFFAVSGFLIGQLLFEVAERDPSFRGWWRFMVRRWMRTIPAYALCLLAFTALWPPPDQTVEHLASYATFTQNLLWPMPADNWFGVAWSLSVEEWFYLLFSASLLLVAGVAGRHRNACIPGRQRRAPGISLVGCRVRASLSRAHCGPVDRNDEMGGAAGHGTSTTTVPPPPWPDHEAGSRPVLYRFVQPAEINRRRERECLKTGIDADHLAPSWSRVGKGPRPWMMMLTVS